MIGAIATIIVGVAGAFLGTHLTQRASIATAKELAKLDQRRAIKDRLWDYQRDAYSAMIATVRSMWSQSEALADAYQRGDTGGGFEAATEAFWKDWSAALTQFHAGRLIFSHPFHDRYEALIKAVIGASAGTVQCSENYHEWLGKHLGATFSDLVEIARRDIGTDLT